MLWTFDVLHNLSCRSKVLSTKVLNSVVAEHARSVPWGQPCTLMNGPPGFWQPQVCEHNIRAAHPMPEVNRFQVWSQPTLVEAGILAPHLHLLGRPKKHTHTTRALVTPNWSPTICRGVFVSSNGILLLKWSGLGCGGNFSPTPVKCKKGVVFQGPVATS